MRTTFQATLSTPPKFRKVVRALELDEAQFDGLYLEDVTGMVRDELDAVLGAMMDPSSIILRVR